MEVKHKYTEKAGVPMFQVIPVIEAKCGKSFWVYCDLKGTTPHK